MFAKLDAIPSPRLIKSHLPFELLPKELLETCKVVFVARSFLDTFLKITISILIRNVKDAAVSFFYHERLMKHHDLIDMPFERLTMNIFARKILGPRGPLRVPMISVRKVFFFNQWFCYKSLHQTYQIIYFLKAHDPHNPLTHRDDKDSDKYTHTQIQK